MQSYLSDDLENIRSAFAREGYVVVEGIFQYQDLEYLRKAAQNVTQLTRDGKWNHRRIVGKQFPPYDTVSSPDSWGVQHLMHPNLPHHKVFTSFYGSSPLLDIAAFILNAKVENMQLELFNLLIEPAQHCFALGWHRDDIKSNIDAEQEEIRLKAPTSGIQWNACLYDDDCLFLVPGTHARLRTKEEVQANQTDPPQARLYNNDDATDCGFDGRWEHDPSTALRVSLKAGQTAFYSQRILHRASYLPSRKRATLHGCYGDVGSAENGSKYQEYAKIVASERARNVLQHGVEWMREQSFGKELPNRLKPMWQNLLKMGAIDKTSLGFSLEG